MFKSQAAAASRRPEAMTATPCSVQRRRNARFKPTTKRHQPGQPPNSTTKTLYCNSPDYDHAGPPRNPQPIPPTAIPCQIANRHQEPHTPPPRTRTQLHTIQQADTHTTVRGFLTCAAIVAWSIHEQAITKAHLAGPTQLFELAKRAWTVPAFPSICFAALHAAALWATFGTTTTAQFIRGCATEA